ncbi:MBL fold metallo-hydrolase RNA specificity domain-containing protein [Colwellia sp. Arc7-635]|nr:MBL fold metallo-hydrolase RNA specificity domain-containing protein [Colwellia sp. Arc7-635]
MDWYQGFENKPPVVLVHGEGEAMDVLAQKLKHEYEADVVQASYKQSVAI